MGGLLKTLHTFNCTLFKHCLVKKTLLKPAVAMSQAHCWLGLSRCWLGLRAEEAEWLLVRLWWSWHSVRNPQGPGGPGTGAAMEAGDEGSEEKGQQGIMQRCQRGREHGRSFLPWFGVAVKGCSV